MSHIAKKLRVHCFTVKSLVKLTIDPTDTMQVFNMVDHYYSNYPLFRREFEFINKRSDLSSIWNDFFVEKYRPKIIGESDEAALPENSFGSAYIKFMSRNGFKKEFYTAVPNHEVYKEAYIEDRLRRVHDFWHVITGFEGGTEGELAVQAFSFGLTRSPISFMIVLAGLLRTLIARPFATLRTMRSITHSYRQAKNNRAIIRCKFEDHWSTPLSDLRDSYGIKILTPKKSA